MKQQFFAYIKPTEEEYKEIWESCGFTFDTNILLNFYRYKNDTTNTFFDLLDKLKDRIYLTHQVCQEYFRNRLDVISEQEKAYSEVRDSIQKNVEEPLQNQRKHPYVTTALLAELQEITTKIKNELDTRSKEYSQRLSNDEILTTLTKVFYEKVGIEFTEEKLNEIYLEGDRRYNQNIPPGFKDKNKGGTKQYGDLVLWFQIIELAKSINKNIVFVTDDEKEDWLYIHKGRTISLLPELQNEFERLTKKRIYIYTAQKFIEFASKHLNTVVKEETIDEVRTLREETKFAIIEDLEELAEPAFHDESIDSFIDNHLEIAIRTIGDENGWADLPTLGVFLIRHTPLNYRNFGYGSLRKFIESRKRFEIKVIQKSPNAKNVDSAFVRVKQSETQ